MEMHIWGSCLDDDVHVKHGSDWKSLSSVQLCDAMEYIQSTELPRPECWSGLELVMLPTISTRDIMTFSWEPFNSRKHMYHYLIFTPCREGHAVRSKQTVSTETEAASWGEVCVDLWEQTWKQGPMVYWTRPRYAKEAGNQKTGENYPEMNRSAKREKVVVASNSKVPTF